MRPPIISPIKWPLRPRRPILPHFRGLGFTDGQFTPPFIDMPPPGVMPSIWGDGSDTGGGYSTGVNPGVDMGPSGGMLPEVTVSNTPIYPTSQPVWPLLVILGVAGYTLFWMGGHK